MSGPRFSPERRWTSRADLIGGVAHLLVEMGAVLAVIAAAAAVAWLILALL